MKGYTDQSSLGLWLDVSLSMTSYILILLSNFAFLCQYNEAVILLTLCGVSLLYARFRL